MVIDLGLGPTKMIEIVISCECDCQHKCIACIFVLCVSGELVLIKFGVQKKRTVSIVIGYA